MNNIRNDAQTIFAKNIILGGLITVATIIICRDHG